MACFFSGFVFVRNFFTVSASRAEFGARRQEGMKRLFSKIRIFRSLKNTNPDSLSSLLLKPVASDFFPRLTAQLLGLVFGSFAIVNIGVAGPEPSFCMQFGGAKFCAPADDSHFETYLLSNVFSAKEASGAIADFNAQANALARQAAELSTATYGYALRWIEYEYVSGSCEKGLPYLMYNISDGYVQGAQPSCSSDFYTVTPATRTFLTKGGSQSVSALASCPAGTTLDGYRYTATNAPSGIDTTYLGKGVNPKWVCSAPANKSTTSDNDSGADSSGNNKTSTCYGKPCDAATGNEHYVVTDYRGSGPFPLTLTRTYNSLFGGNGSLGPNWVSNYGDPVQGSLILVTTKGMKSAMGMDIVQVTSPKGGFVYFKDVGGIWTPDADVTDTLTQSGFIWTYTSHDGTVEIYDSSLDKQHDGYIDYIPKSYRGRLLSVTNRAGLTHTLTRDPATHQLNAVTDSFGHSLTFTYDAKGRLSTMTDPNDGITSYAYDDANNIGNLSTVTYPDGKFVRYTYSEAGNVPVGSKIPHALTGIFDENNSRYASLSYDGYGKTTLTQLADVGFGGPQEKYTLAYIDNITAVTDAVGNKEYLSFTSNLNVKNLTYKSYTADSKTIAQTFDNRNNLTCKKDEEGHVSIYTYNARNQMTSKTDGRTGTCSSSVPTTATRTTSYQYLSDTLSLPTLIETPSVYTGGKKQVSIGYSKNLPTTITQSGYTPSGAAVARSVTLAYNTSGQVISIDGPRTDVADVTTLDYNTCTTGGGCGQLWRVTNALGQVTTYDNYDAGGRLLQMTDPNGVQTVYSYDARGRVLSTTQTAPGGGSRITTYGYDGVGNVTSTSLPSGLTLTYTYDAAHYLRRVSDNLGNYIDYGYDLKGNRTKTYTYDSSGALVRTVDLAFDARNRVSQINAGGSITKQVSDAVGNLTKITDPNTVAVGGTAATSNSYDNLNRLFKTVDLLAGNTQYGYDVNDRLKGVSAPNGATTQYSYDDLGNLLQETSPDRGTLRYTYDASGNLLQQTDARGIAVTYAYDALNRLTNSVYPDSSENLTYTYDADTDCAHGVGRLCTVQDAAGFSAFAYNGFGNLVTDRRTELSIAYTTRYAYDGGNRVTSITYPNGRQVSYTRDAQGNIQMANMSLGGITTSLLSAAIYHPDGLPTSRSFGNGLTDIRAYDTQGQLRELYLGSADTRLYGYDANGNLTALQSLPEVDSWSYDVLNRLKQENRNPGTAVTTLWTYDANGNRKTQNTGTYSYLAASNRLTTTPNGGITLDAAGNTTADGLGRSFQYNQAGQLSAVPSSGASYAYNHQRQRSRKIVGSEATVYHYDLAGNLLAETRVDGSLLRDYVYLDSTPIAKIEAGETLAYLHTDHLNTPRLATNPQGQIVWRWEGTAFGESFPKEDVDGDGKLTTINLRFPGQYYDQETGLHYNWMRYYDPKSGRYITSDPIGLDGGLNTYAYVGSNPLFWIDPDGLRVLNPHNYPISPSVMNALKQFNHCIGCDKDIEITGGNRRGDPGQHGKGLAADIVVPGQNHLLTANQAIACGIFGGVGWYQEGYYDPSDPKVGPHVHVDLGPSGRVWGYDVNGYPYSKRIPKVTVRNSLSCGNC